ncbi:MAG: tetratricopeptide repeat protein [Verrucomicrobia bacterium]|nr:tetratricopeptide repeat protein [Verrucomicrobiota bacterium]
MNSAPAESTADIDFLAWLEVNKQRLIYGVGGAIVVGFGLWSFLTMKAQKENVASAELLKIQMASSMAEQPTSPPASVYSEFMKKHAGTRAAERAMLLAADAAFTEQKFAEAQNLFEQFRKDYPSSPLVGQAAYGVGASLEAQKKTAEATAVYQDVVTRFAGTSLAGQTKLSLARMHEASNKPQEALKLYEELSSGTSFSSWTSEAAAKKDALLAKHPELVSLKPATNAAPTEIKAGPEK